MLVQEQKVRVPQGDNQVTDILHSNLQSYVQDQEEHGAQAGEVQHVLQQVHQLAQL